MSTSLTQSLVLGIVQGLTEFLPISSSAHLILLPRFIGWTDPGLAFDVALHLGTLAGVLAYFWQDLWDIPRETVGFLIIATVPGAMAGAGMLKFKAILLSPDKMALAAGCLGAALAGFAAIWALMKYVQTRRFTPFVIYRWILGALVLLNLPRFG